MASNLLAAAMAKKKLDSQFVPNPENGYKMVQVPVVPCSRVLGVGSRKTVSQKVWRSRNRHKSKDILKQNQASPKTICPHPQAQGRSRGLTPRRDSARVRNAGPDFKVSRQVAGLPPARISLVYVIWIEC